MKLKYLVGILGLLVVQWIGGVFSIGHGPAVECCPKISTVRVKVSEIESYLHQNEGPCRISAIRFTLKNGKVICSNPEDSWAINATKKLDGRATKPPKITVVLPKTTTGTSSPGTSTTMMTPNVTPTTHPVTYIPHTASIKQPLRNTNRPPQRTTTAQITTRKQSTTMESKPNKPESNPTTVITTTETRPTQTTTPEGPSTTQKTTTFTRNPSTASTKQPPGTTNKQTTKQITTKQDSITEKRRTETTKPKMTSMTKRTENRVTPPTPKETSTTVKPTMDTSRQTASMVITTMTESTSTTQQSTTTTTKCRPKSTTKEASRKKGGKIPWTVRRLIKKRKPGLRRAQMKSWSLPECP